MNFEQACAVRSEENRRVLSYLPADVVRREYSSAFWRWPEYMFMSPLECTEKFASAYRDAFRFTYGIGCNGFQCNPGTPEFVTIWKMRQSADQCGVSYPLYLEVCFSLYRRKDPAALSIPSLKFAKREETRSWRKKFAQTVVERIFAETLRAASLPQYRVEHYRALPAQNRLRSRVSSLAAGKRWWGHFLEEFFVRLNAVPAEDVLSGLTDPDQRSSAIDSARASVRRGAVTRMPPTSVDEGGFLQSCFGLARKGRENNACDECPLRGPCLSATEAFSQLDACG